MKTIVMSRPKPAMKQELGKLLDGLNNDRIRGDNFPPLYYVSGIPEVDEWLKIPMWEQRVGMEFRVHTYPAIVLVFTRGDDNLLIGIEEEELKEWTFTICNGNVRKTSLTQGFLSSGKMGLLGVVLGEAKKQFSKVEHENVKGVEIALISTTDDRPVIFFAEYPVNANETLQMMKKFFKEKCPNLS